MSGLLLSVRAVLAAVFLVAGATKLLDRDGSRRVLEDFGVPAWGAGVGSVALPLIELAVAVGLLVTGAAQIAVACTLVLLGLFIGAIVLSLARGRAPDCHCFGQLHSTPVGWKTLARNAVLAGAAVFVLVAGGSNPGTSATRWITTLNDGWIAAAALVLLLAATLGLLGWFCLQLLRQNGRMLERLEALEHAVTGRGPAERLTLERHNPTPAPPAGLPLGTPAPEFALPAVDGGVVSLAQLRQPGHPVLLVFSHPGCGPCGALLPEVAGWQAHHRDRLTVAVLSEGSVADNRAKTAEHALSNVLLRDGQSLNAAYRAFGTPTGVVVSSDGLIGSGVAAGAEAIRALVPQALALAATAIAARTPSPGPGPGERAPAFELRDLVGRTRRSCEFLGRELLVLSWNPGCGYCQRMLEDLRGWDADPPPPEGPELLVLHAGDVEPARAMGLRSTVLIDEGGLAAGRFGLRGTPMAVRVDASGRIDSDVAAGASAVLTLANGSPEA